MMVRTCTWRFQAGKVRLGGGELATLDLSEDDLSGQQEFLENNQKNLKALSFPLNIQFLI